MEAGLVDNLQKYQWCTHKIYLSDSKKWKWLHKDYILKLFSKSKPKSIRLYKQFVLKETPEEINQIFERRNLPAVLGSKSFVDKIKDKFFNLKNFEEIPETKKLAPDIDKIKYSVCKAYNIKEKELYVTRRGYFNEPRNVAVYMIRHLRNDTLKQVGEQFGIEKYSTVSSIVERVKFEMKVDKELKKRVQNLAEKIIKSQRQT
ncbi:MAG: transposase [Candidatus Heimdallarchaeota archaeon]|nr:transposase [Candidatus Heimdallarchaeota archaeon]